MKLMKKGKQYVVDGTGEKIYTVLEMTENTNYTNMKKIYQTTLGNVKIVGK